MNRGCSIGLMLAILIAGVVGYLGYRFANSLAEIPDDLALYQHQDSIRAMVQSKAPAPSGSARLTEPQVATLLVATDSANAILKQFTGKLTALAHGDAGIVKGVSGGMELVRQLSLIPLSVRRSLVSVLNQQNRSWAEFTWMKERAVAAAAITPSDVDSAVRVLLRSTLGDTTTAKIQIPDGEVRDFYRRTDSLRTSGGIDSMEIALMRPYRTVLLERGLLLLLGLDQSNALAEMVVE